MEGMRITSHVRALDLEDEGLLSERCINLIHRFPDRNRPLGKDFYRITDFIGINIQRSFPIPLKDVFIVDIRHVPNCPAAGSILHFHLEAHREFLLCRYRTGCRDDRSQPVHISWNRSNGALRVIRDVCVCLQQRNALISADIIQVPGKLVIDHDLPVFQRVVGYRDPIGHDITGSQLLAIDVISVLVKYGLLRFQRDRVDEIVLVLRRVIWLYILLGNRVGMTCRQLFERIGRVAVRRLQRNLAVFLAVLVKSDRIRGWTKVPVIVLVHPGDTAIDGNISIHRDVGCRTDISGSVHGCHMQVGLGRIRKDRDCCFCLLRKGVALSRSSRSLCVVIVKISDCPGRDHIGRDIGLTKVRPVIQRNRLDLMTISCAMVDRLVPDHGRFPVVYCLYSSVIGNLRSSQI